jgi:hypothetical protein
MFIILKASFHLHYNKYILKGYIHSAIYGHNFDDQSEAILQVLHTVQSSSMLAYNKE